jgi:hypothetical protein
MREWNEEIGWGRKHDQVLGGPDGGVALIPKTPHNKGLDDKE